jgi:hypothetical protein
VRVIGVVFGKASLLTRVFRFPAAPVESRRESPPQQAVRGWLTTLCSTVLWLAGRVHLQARTA